MYTVIVTGILIFPWTLVGVSIVGWLAYRRASDNGPSSQGNSGSRSKVPVRRL